MTLDEVVNELKITRPKLLTAMRVLGIKGKSGQKMKQMTLGEGEISRIRTYLHASAQLAEAQRKFDFVLKDLKS